MTKKYKAYPIEFKEQCVKEALDIGNIASVAQKHKVHYGILHRWVNLQKNSDNIKISSTDLKLKKRLEDAELEIRVLKELLKKTNQAWLKE